MGLSDQPFEVMCPDCGAMLKIDPVTRQIIAHTSAPRKKTFEDLGAAARALKDADARRESIFAQSVEAQKNKDDRARKEVRRGRQEGEGIAHHRQAAARVRSRLAIYQGNGGRGRNRTFNLSIKSRMLCQLSYASRPESARASGANGSEVRKENAQRRTCAQTEVYHGVIARFRPCGEVYPTKSTLARCGMMPRS